MAIRPKKSEPVVDAKGVARRLNEGKLRGLLTEGDEAFRVNGSKQVVACHETFVDFRSGRLPAHASDELVKLAEKGLSGLGVIEEVKVPVGGRDRAGWRAGGFIVYHHPIQP